MNNTRKSKDQLVKDLQAAQDEIEIGKALDRVRAQALGMQESHELDEVSFTLSAELSQLLPEMVSSSIGTVDRDKRVIHDAQQLPDWSSGEVMPVIRYGIDEIDSSSPMWHAKDIYEAREQGKAIYRMDKWRDGHVASLFKWFDQYFTTNHPDVNFKFPKAPGASASVWVFSETGWIAAHRSSREPFDDQEITVIKRFADIFDFAYSRFLELKEKEEQVRVADQRAAVDRVRAEAAGMEGTEDIANVVKTLWEGLQGQNVDYDFLSMEVIDEDANL
ncbi:MAG: hypothetical protein QGG64_20895, partial [Candidatus Latescibacteria bacterium]|nr:hypothetical protein [Candidatus Latescibacterota bacterium]